MSTKTAPPTDWREQRRLQAVKLHESGWPQKKIAEAFGVTEGAVSQWLKKARMQGVEALRHRPPPGRPSKLSAEQRAQLPALLAKGPEAYDGFIALVKNPIFLTGELLVIAAALIHGLNGIRIGLTSFGIAGGKQKQLFVEIGRASCRERV